MLLYVISVPQFIAVLHPTNNKVIFSLDTSQLLQDIFFIIIYFMATFLFLTLRQTARH